MNLPGLHVTRGTEQSAHHTPVASLVLAYAAMVPLVAGAAATVALGRNGESVARLSTGWAAAVLCFLSGVRRGLSFRQPGGSTLGQIGTTLWLFTLGAGASLSPRRVPALLLLLLGFGSERALDPAAARRGEAPDYFQRLRPAQMAVPILSLLVLLVSEINRAGPPPPR